MRTFHTEDIGSTILFLFYTFLFSISSFSYAHDNEYNNRPPGVSLTTFSKVSSTALHICEQTLNSYPYWGLNYHCTEHRESENGIGYWQPHDCSPTYPYTCSSLPIYDGFPIEKKEDYKSRDNAKDACELFLQDVYNNGGNGECLEKGDTESMYFAHDYDHDGEVRPGCKHWYRHDFNTPPDVTIKTPENGSTHFNNTDISFRGTAGDDDEGNLDFNIRWSVDGYAVTGNSFKRAFNAGNYTVTAKVTDARGVTATDSHTFTVKSHGISLGTINVTLGANHQAYMPVPISISSAKIDDLDSRNLVRWTIDGVDYGVHTSLSPILNAGSHTIIATLALDGNSVTKTSTFTVAPNIPVLTVKRPRGGSIFDIKETVNFDAAVVFKGVPSTTADFSWQSDRVGSLGNSKSFNLSGLAEGLHTITVTATDGGETDSHSFVFTIYDAEKNMGDQTDGQCFGGNPINLLTGNKYHSEIDFSTATETPLYLKRSYNSASKYLSIFGRGWSSNIEERIEHNLEAQQASVVSETGAVQRFDYINGSWSDNSSSLGVLEEDSNGTWRYTMFSGTVKEFDSSGRIERVTARNKLTIIYEYEGTRLSAIRDEYGNELTFTYTAAGFVETMTDPDGFEYIYEYESDKHKAVIYPDETTSSDDNPRKEYQYEDTSLSNGLTGIIDEEGIRFATWRYDDAGRAYFSKHAEDKEEFTIVYNADGSVTTTNMLGLSTTYQYESIKGILKVRYVKGHESAHCASTYTSTEYDSETGFTSERMMWNGDKVKTTTNDFGQVESTTIVDFNADWSTHYDYGRGYSENVVEVTTSTAYNEERLPQSITRPGLLVEYKYTLEGRLDLVTKSDTTTHKFPYSTKGDTRITNFEYEFYEDTNVVQRIIIDGARTDVNDLTTLEFGLDGLLSKRTNAEAHVFKYFDYNSRGLPSRQIDPNGLEVQYIYTPRGQIKSKTIRSAHGRTAVTGYTYYKNGMLKAQTEPNGTSLHYYYNDARKIDYIRNDIGEIINYEPNPLNGDWSQLQYIDYNGVIKYELNRLFDEKGRVREETNLVDGKINFEHDGGGNLQRRIQRAGVPGDFARSKAEQIVDYRYDAFNRLRYESFTYSTQYYAISNRYTVYDFDTAGNLVRVNVNTRKHGIGDPTVGEKQTTHYVYNGFGELLSENSPATGITIHRRDSVGNVVSTTNSEGQKVSITYDALNRRLTETYDGASAEDRVYVYDLGLNGIGKLSSTKLQAGNESYSYDDLGYADKTNYRIGKKQYSIDYDFGSGGYLNRVRYPTGHAVIYQYDGAGRVSLIEYQKGSSDYRKVLSDIEYLPFGPATSYRFGNGSYRTADHDDYYRVTKLTYVHGDYSESVGYGYSQDNSILTQTQNKHFLTDNVEDKKTFMYDHENRLQKVTWVKENNVDLARNEYYWFDYDKFGNRTEKRFENESGTSGGIWNYTVSRRDNQLESILGPDMVVGGLSKIKKFAYYETGQIENDDQYSYSYNRSQRLTTVASGAGAIGTYQYNSIGQRTAKTVNGKTVHFHYSLGGQLLAETTQDGDIIREYIYYGSIPVAMITGDRSFDSATETSKALTKEIERHIIEHGESDSFKLTEVSSDQYISAKISDSSKVTGNSGFTLTMREQPNGFSGAKVDVKVVADSFLIIPMNDLNIPIPFRDEKTKTGYIEITVVQATGARETKRYERDGGWIKMSRDGQYVNVLSSVDGVNWTTLEQYTVPTLETIYMGSTISAVVSKLDINDLAASDSVFYLYTDHIGTPVKAISNDRREIVWARKDFKIGASPFGFDQMPNGRNLHDGLIAMPLRFPGQYYDQETVTNYNYFRDYDPSIGRYIQSDPIGLGGGPNTYGYVGGNPLVFSDPLGLATQYGAGASATGAFFLGVNFSLNLGLSVPDNWKNWRCYQIYGGLSAAPMIGAGAYVGVGAMIAGGETSGPLPTGFNSTVNRYLEADVGWGVSAGASQTGATNLVGTTYGQIVNEALWNEDPVGLQSGSINPSVGYGGYVGAGIVGNYGFATPTIGDPCSCE